MLIKTDKLAKHYKASNRLCWFSMTPKEQSAALKDKRIEKSLFERKFVTPKGKSENTDESAIIDQDEE